MSVKDLVTSAFNKNAVAFENAFNEVMIEKMERAIASKYQSMFKEEKDEMDDDEEDDEEDEEDEEEQINEVSKEKLKNYMNAARKDMRNRYYDDSDESDKKFFNRSKGIEKALDKRDANSKARVPATESFDRTERE